ncbi:MAG: YgeY family selenium metabolism-linked hydrolase, partial [Candidatus Krumholzibacteria bacterium]|nr:YgeY family selenium metabolism-linked hydrolase [Candidatus Krumholzibacteria bacterium]
MSETIGQTIAARAAALQEPMIAFLRDIVAIPSLSGQEEGVIRRIEAEMKKVGFDEVRIDALGNVLGRIGNGPRIIAFDAHVDTVDVSDPSQWDCDPFKGKVEDGKVFGRGSVDQKAGMAGMVYAAVMMKELNLLDGFTVWMTGTVMEEDCDGLCWHHILSEKTINPELVVSTEPTGLKIHRGQRGRMEIRVRVKGRSCHGSMPHLGDNAIYKIAPAIQAIEKLNDNLKTDDFLGKGTCTISWIGCQTPSLCAVPDEAEFHIDRRLTVGETRESALAEVQQAVKAAGVEAEVFTLTYEEKAWTGLIYPMDKYDPTWILP